MNAEISRGIRYLFRIISCSRSSRIMQVLIADLCTEFLTNAKMPGTWNSFFRPRPLYNNEKKGGRQRRFTDLLPKGLFQVGESTTAEFNCIDRDSGKPKER